MRFVPRRQSDPPFGNPILRGGGDHAGTQRMPREILWVEPSRGATRLNDAGDAAICQTLSADAPILADGAKDRRIRSECSGFYPALQSFKSNAGLQVQHFHAFALGCFGTNRVRVA